MPYTTKQRVRRQRQRRKAGQIKRFEFVLSSENARDRELYDFLVGLPRGAVSDFIKVAILEKMQCDGEHQTPEAPSASEQLNTILAELAALREVVTQPIYAQAERPILRASSESLSQPGATVSSGLDMSAPRRKRDSASPGVPISQAPPPVPEELTEVQRTDLARQLVNSIKGFGQNRSEGR